MTELKDRKCCYNQEETGLLEDLEKAHQLCPVKGIVLKLVCGLPASPEPSHLDGSTLCCLCLCG